MVVSPKRKVVKSPKKSPKKRSVSTAPAPPVERGLVVLDIDGTIIDTISGKETRPKYKKRLLQFQDHHIYARPYAKDFIKYLLKKYDVGIWTFATGDYAWAILMDGFGFKPEDFVFFYTRDFPPPFHHNHDLGVKQIERLPFPHRKRILVDDNLHNVMTNEKDKSTPHNRAVRIKEFKVTRPTASSDIELHRMKKRIADRLGY